MRNSITPNNEIKLSNHFGLGPCSQAAMPQVVLRLSVFDNQLDAIKTDAVRCLCSSGKPDGH